MARWLVFATLLIALGTTPPAAAIDLSGDYVGFAVVPFSVKFVQTGTDLKLDGHIVYGGTTYPLAATGTVNPDTGAFSVTGDITPLCPGFDLSGTGDGEETSTIFTSNSACPSGPIFLTKCGNGVIDPLENCEDANAADGDCCSARCRLDPAGTTCTSDGNGCTDEVCNATGACLHVPNSGPCDDGNACTLGEVCAGGTCVPGSTLASAQQACTDDFDPCTADVCDATGTCTHVPVSPAECRARTACHSSCTQQLKACRQTCPEHGQARRTCRAACADRSTCAAPGAPIRTLAYVVTDCSTDRQGRSALTQKLLIRHGNCDPITATEVTVVPASDPVPDPTQHCRNFPGDRWGSASVAYGALQRLGVSPDGSGVVFEVNDEFSMFPHGPFPGRPSEEKGLFFVRADGTGRRRLGPASREQCFGAPAYAFPPPLPFSPNGRRIAFTDRGADPGEERTVQIVVLDLATGERTQVTHLPSGTAPVNPVYGPFLLTCCPTFVDDETILFGTFVDPVVDGKHLNPEHSFQAFTVRIDGSQFTGLTAPVASQNAHLVPTFGVSGRRGHLIRYAMDGTSVNGDQNCGGPGAPRCIFPIEEIFIQAGKQLLGLTSFRQVDTFIGFLNTTRTRAFFLSSADRGENPHQNCQLFSVDTLGGQLRQVTHFNDGEGSPPGVRACFGNGLPNCSVGEGYSRLILQDPVTHTVVFASSCDPFSTNPNGGQLFAMQPEGHGLRQLTDAAGIVANPDGSIRVELPGPFAYSAPVP